MVPIQFGVDIFEELNRLGFNEFCVPEAVIFEIERLIKREKGSDRTAAKVARSMMGRCERIAGTGSADDVILRLAKNMGAAVLTNDRELKRRLADNRDTDCFPASEKQAGHRIKSHRIFLR